MKTITLNEIKKEELPLYVEHMGRFYLLSAVPSDWTYIPPVHPAGGTSLEAYASRQYNVYTAEEFKEVLSGVESSLETEKKVEVKAMDGNHATSKEEVIAAQEQKAADLETAKALVASTLVASTLVAPTLTPTLTPKPEVASTLAALKK